MLEEKLYVSPVSQEDEENLDIENIEVPEEEEEEEEEEEDGDDDWGEKNE